MKTTKVGIIGCGMISDAYFKASSKFNILEVVACSDIIPERSAKKYEMYGVPNVTNEELLANKDIEIVINLTPPQVHSKIAMDALNAGKHTHSEKPFGVDAADAARLVANGFVTVEGLKAADADALEAVGDIDLAALRSALENIG